MGVSKNTPKWMVFFRENPIRIDDLGGISPTIYTIFRVHPYKMGSLFIPQQKKTLWFFVTQQKPYGFLVIPHSPIFFYQSQAANTKSNCPNWASQTACFATRILEAAQWQLAIKGGFSGETWMLWKTHGPLNDVYYTYMKTIKNQAKFKNAWFLWFSCR